MNRELTYATLFRDLNQTINDKYYLNERNHFNRNLDSSVPNTGTGVIAAEEINIFNAKIIRKYILNFITWKSIDRYMFKMMD